ncbi:STAS domain-containing protein [Actinomadura kijaniata]|uniref:Anti-sigma factor antagonist n=1 Tax=Actinomadura namibiensis TaxID=182080 RepID=A0A7W3QQR0_ACTNM|nr:STAS domain-containing protein [Actinomadura namibiensis]MBA8955990.1 anti-anti-sigma factor [Actinomadura namibiensis]
MGQNGTSGSTSPPNRLPGETLGGLQVQVTQRSGYAVVTAAGTIDLTTGQLLDQALEQVAELTRAAVLLDIAAVRFCDSSGLKVFVRWHHKLERQGMSLVVCAASDPLARTFALTGLDQALYQRPDVGEALRWLDTGHTRLTSARP